MNREGLTSQKIEKIIAGIGSLLSFSMVAFSLGKWMTRTQLGSSSNNDPSYCRFRSHPHFVAFTVLASCFLAFAIVAGIAAVVRRPKSFGFILAFYVMFLLSVFFATAALMHGNETMCRWLMTNKNTRSR